MRELLLREVYDVEDGKAVSANPIKEDPMNETLNGEADWRITIDGQRARASQTPSAITLLRSRGICIAFVNRRYFLDLQRDGNTISSSTLNCRSLFVGNAQAGLFRKVEFHEPIVGKVDRQLESIPLKANHVIPLPA